MTNRFERQIRSYGPSLQCYTLASIPIIQYIDVMYSDIDNKRHDKCARELGALIIINRFER